MHKKRTAGRLCQQSPAESLPAASAIPFRRASQTGTSTVTLKGRIATASRWRSSRSIVAGEYE